MDLSFPLFPSSSSSMFCSWAQPVPAAQSFLRRCKPYKVRFLPAERPAQLILPVFPRWPHVELKPGPAWIAQVKTTGCSSMPGKASPRCEPREPSNGLGLPLSSSVAACAVIVEILWITYNWHNINCPYVVLSSWTSTGILGKTRRNLGSVWDPRNSVSALASAGPAWMSGAAVGGMGEFSAISADLCETCSSHTSCSTTLHY